MLYAAAIIIVVLALAHSVLGERFLIRPLLRRENLPKLLGSAEFTRHTVRYCWHLTSVMAFGMAWLLVQLQHGQSGAALVRALGITLFAATALALVLTRARHLSWVGLLMAGVICMRFAG